MGCTMSTEQEPDYDTQAPRRCPDPPGPSTRPADAPNNNANPKIEGSLAWPGRDRVDPLAPYFIVDAISEEALQTRRYHSQSRAQSITSGDATVVFKEIVGNVVQSMPLDGLYERQGWVVGAAANPWRAVKQAPLGINQRLAHWGVYIRLQSAPEEVSEQDFGKRNKTIDQFV